MPGSLRDERILKLIGRLLQEHRDMIVRPATATTALDMLSTVKGMVDGASFAGGTRKRRDRSASGLHTGVRERSQAMFYRDPQSPMALKAT
jgi:hypothetical protein